LSSALLDDAVSTRALLDQLHPHAHFFNHAGVRIGVMDTLTPVILFGAAAIAGHTYGEEWLARVGLRQIAERYMKTLRRLLFG
jgi:hypothetical protein